MTRTQSFLLGLFSVCGFVFASSFSNDAQAQYYRSPTTYVWPGSEVAATGLIGDDKAQILDSVPSDLFFETLVTTETNQSTNCFYDGKPALCRYVQPLNCVKFEIGDCRNGQRESLQKCTTADAGCTGTIEVTLLDGSQEPFPLAISKDPTIGTDNKSCNNYFPQTTDLPKGVMGKVVQQCSSRTAPWSVNDRVLKQVVRNDDNVNTSVAFSDSSEWLLAATATCDPAKGLPGGACTNQGIINITFPVATPAACSASNLLCGQSADGQSGPSPVGDPACTYDATSQQCTCKCNRCGSDGKTLVNVGIPAVGTTSGWGVYAIADKAKTSAAACPVEITGTN